MLTIYKYPFQIADRFELTLPTDRKVLHADVQPGTGPCLWVMVNPHSAEEVVTFHVFGTGMEIDPEEVGKNEFVSTFQQPPFVWHLFRKITERELKDAKMYELGLRMLGR
jgi:hypothetical protein